MDKTFFNRLQRLEGQLKKLQESIAKDTDCKEVIPQFLAVKGALNSAFELYLQESFHRCSSKDETTMRNLIALIAKS